MADENLESVDYDDSLYDMSDEELERAFKESKAALQSPETAYEEENQTDEETDNESEEDTDMDQPEESEEESDEISTDEAEDEESTEDVDKDEESDDETEENLEDEESADTETDEQSQSESTEDKSKEESTEAKKLSVKANGQTFEFTKEEALEQFPAVFSKAIDYTRKTQELKPWAKQISALKEANIAQEDLNVMIDAFKGNKDAIATIIKKADIDTLDIDTENTKDYIPNQYGKDDRALAIEEAVAPIMNDEEYVITHNVIEEQWDDKSRQAFVRNPQLIQDLHYDVKNGIYDKVAPLSMKMKVMDGGRKSDIEYYILAGRQLTQQEEAAKQSEPEKSVPKPRVNKEVEEIKSREAKRAATKKASKKRKAAAPTKTSAGKRDVIDYLSEDDEQFDEWYRQVQDKM